MVAPGQGGPKTDAFADIFNPRNAVDGVVFVAGSGFVTLRDEAAVDVAIENGSTTVAKWRDLQRGEEIEYLKEVLLLMEGSQKECQRPKWMLVAATKADLYYDEIEDVKKYYSPHSKAIFSTNVDRFVGKVGSNNFDWDAVPACSWLEDFRWSKEIISSKLNEKERNHYLAQMVAKMGELCQ